jgi:hypothetical protein
MKIKKPWCIPIYTLLGLVIRSLNLIFIHTFHDRELDLVDSLLNFLYLNVPRGEGLVILEVEIP